MKKVLVRVLATIGGWVVVSLTLGLVISVLTRRHVADGTVLEIDFAAGIVEQAPPGLRSLFMESPLTVRDVVDALTRAAEDERVAAVVAKVGDARLGLASLQEIRDAVAVFRRSGKRTVALAESFGEFGPGNGAYYLATAFKEIYLQPSGDLGLVGIATDTPFVRGALDKLGVKPRLDHREQYKSAMNIFTERGYTKPHREASEHVLRRQFAQIVRGIAAGRELPEARVRELVNRGPLSASMALDAELVDELAYRDQVWEQFRGADGELPPRLSLASYLDRAGRPNDEGDTVALIYGTGSVHRGRSSWGTFSNEPTMGSETVTAAFRAAVDDDEVRAILFRVDSPGGSYVASDTIWREVARARRLGKPVVVSMGDVAGSGGYFVAMAADRIVAQPGTITGSIGVLAGKMVTTDLWSRLGIEWGTLATAPNATMFSPTQDFTEAQWARLEEFLDRIYADFVDKAAESRGIPRERMLEMAQGRIWTGEDAKELGLVDALGGFPEALRLVRELTGLAPDAPLKLTVFPKPKSPLERAVARLLNRPQDDDAASMLASSNPVQRLWMELQRMPQARALLESLEARGALAMPAAARIAW
ncbi:MAG TPA: signal peptide peptidase SppA [Candidatus Limnocylindria bacterium]|nr:signal peptide peptidase SppA [Candidatus Limnocylindria bacterium]